MGADEGNILLAGLGIKTVEQVSAQQVKRQRLPGGERWQGVADVSGV